MKNIAFIAVVIVMVAWGLHIVLQRAQAPAPAVSGGPVQTCVWPNTCRA